MKRNKPEIRPRNFPNLLALVAALLLLTTVSAAQDGLTVRNDANQKWPSAEAEKVYLSACAVVQREFGASRELRPRVTLVLGANKNNVGLFFKNREIRLAKWDRYMFAQGVVWLAFEDLMPEEQLLLVSKRAVAWADATVAADQIAK